MGKQRKRVVKKRKKIAQLHSLGSIKGDRRGGGDGVLL